MQNVRKCFWTPKIFYLHLQIRRTVTSAEQLKLGWRIYLKPWSSAQWETDLNEELNLATQKKKKKHARSCLLMKDVQTTRAVAQTVETAQLCYDEANLFPQIHKIDEGQGDTPALAQSAASGNRTTALRPPELSHMNLIWIPGWLQTSV